MNKLYYISLAFLLFFIPSEVFAPDIIDFMEIGAYPDPDKDYQYYINRYDNEPSYQDWFDSTFPGLTVYEAVC